MVMSESKEANRNGKKSSNTSPLFAASNKQVQPATDDLSSETSEDDESNSKKQLKPKNGKSEFEEKIRVGKDYQAIVPPLISKHASSSDQDKALLVWSPATCIPDSKLEEYVTLAKERYGYNSEQALGMLFWHKHDLEKAVIDLANFTPFPDEWNKEDKVLFEQAFQFHGKCFHRIRQMLPDKSIASLVKFYYSWKKTRSRTSVMDRQEKRKNEGALDHESDGTPDNSDVEDKKWPSPIRGIQRTSRSPTRNVSNLNADNLSTKSSSKIQDVKRMTGINRIENKDMGYSSSSSSSNGISKLNSLNCQNCKVLCNELKPTTGGGYCTSCFLHWRRTGNIRPVEGPNVQRPRSKTNKLYYYQGYHDGSSKYKKKPPKGMYINHDDVLKLAAHDLSEIASPRKQPLPPKFDLLADTDREISVLYSQIQKNKQKVSSMKKSNEEFHDGRSQEEVVLNRVNIRWTKEEISLAIMGCRKFGQNFKAISEVISTKTESHVRKFFAKYRKSYNLDTVCQESRSNNALKDDNKQDSSIEIMEVIDSDDDENKSNENGNELVKIQGKDTIVVTAKSLKRKLESEFKNEESDEESPQKKIAPLIEKHEITITPIQKVSATDGTVA